MVEGDFALTLYEWRDFEEEFEAFSVASHMPVCAPNRYYNILLGGSVLLYCAHDWDQALRLLRGDQIKTDYDDSDKVQGC